MARPRIFIDGHAGTVGLRIHELLLAGEDLELITLGEAQRKDRLARREAANRADVVVLCLPDDAVREAVAWIENPDTRVLDASTAHRVDPEFVYGLPELEPGHRARIAEAQRVTNPGCYPTPVILLLRPLVESGLVPRNALLALHALSGYSGGGRQLIERWEDPERELLSLRYEAPYALERVHKHVPEMLEYTRLLHAPQFVPAVGPFYSGMRVEIPLHARLLASGVDAKAIWEALEARYADERFVRLRPLQDPPQTDEGSFDPECCNGTNRIELAVAPHPSGHVLLVGLLDNLGKGAAGAAVQNLSLMLGLPEERGLSC
jgi:N-acetyl-gamma-glutamyl-phosphate reductase